MTSSNIVFFLPPGSIPPPPCHTFTRGAWPQYLKDVFVFYGCVTYYHELSSLEQYPFIMSQSPYIRSLSMAEFGPLLRVSQGCHQGVGGAGVFSQAHLAFGRSRFLAAKSSRQLASLKPAGECLSRSRPSFKSSSD